MSLYRQVLQLSKPEEAIFVFEIDSSGQRFFPRYFCTRNLINICTELCNNQLKRETLTRTRNYYKVGAVTC